MRPEEKGKRRMAAFCLWQEGRICYYGSVCMDDEKPLKRADLRKRAEEKAAELAAEGMELHPVTASGRNLAKKFWGKEWMKSLAACEVYGMRLAPGRTYLRYGCVLDVKAAPGRIDALVMGEHLYEVRVHAAPPDEEALARLRARCAGHIGSWIDLLKGNLSPELLEILHLGDKERKASLYRVYRRDIEDNEAFKFREKRVYPIKSDGEIDMQREFMHLTTTDDKEAEGAATKKRVFEPDRSRRLHWIRHHIEERTSHVLEIFSCEERDMKHRKNIYRTYVYDTAEKYVIVLEPQRSPYGYYLLTAYYLNMPGGEKKMKKMLKKKLEEVL